MKVQELLDCEDKWTQKMMARNKYGHFVRCDSPSAVKWCLLGAVYKCYQEGNEIVSKIYNNTKMGIASFNDTHSYEEVMELVRRLDI